MMRRPLSILVLAVIASLVSIPTVVPFSPSVVVQTKTKTIPKTLLDYKSRDEIANELIELIPGEHKARTKDYSPWKRIMELENTEDQVRELQKKLDKVKNEEKVIEKVIENLEGVVFELFYQIVLLEEERNSVPKLFKRLFRVMNERINNNVGKNVDRALKMLHMYHDYE